VQQLELAPVPFVSTRPRCVFRPQKRLKMAEDNERHNDNIEYLSGFGNEFSTEAIKGALPVGQFSPQKCPLGLYAEQISGTSFTMPRGQNLRTWLYRACPSVVHDEFVPVPCENKLISDFSSMSGDPNQVKSN
jgi:homogentisate 1,2-dioxygenase